MTSEVIFRLIIDLIVALSHYAWPVVVLVALIKYRKPISALLDRIKTLELFGNRGEFEPAAVDKFQESVGLLSEKVEEDQTNKYVLTAEPGVLILTERDVQLKVSKSESIDDELTQTEIDVSQILDDSRGSPELAIIRLSNLLENESHAILQSMGILPSRKMGLSAFRAIRELETIGLLPENTSDSLLQFRQLRNFIVHGNKPIEEKEVLRVLDTGVELLKTIRAIPHEKHFVENVVDVYEDLECSVKKQGVRGLILNSKDPDGKIDRRLCHTSKTDYYRAGDRVAWEWDETKTHNESTYLDEGDGSVKRINHSFDFIGRRIE